MTTEDPRKDIAYEALYASMRYDSHVWYEALKRAVPSMLLALDSLDESLRLERDQLTTKLAEIAEQNRDLGWVPVALLAALIGTTP